MVRKPNYCKGVIIAHGKSELLLAEHIKSNLHLNIEIYSEQNGNKSIQIDSLMNVLGNTIFKNKNSLKKKYGAEEQDKKLVNFFVIPIMDLDDTTKEKIERYKNGDMFKKHWLSSYIIPVWNDTTLDKVLYELNIIDRIPTRREKGKTYEKIFPKNNGQTEIEQMKELLKKFKSSANTNMDILIKECLKNIEKFD